MPAPRRIALFVYSTKPRGGVIHAIELATALHQLGHTICLYALDKDGTGFQRYLPCNHRLVPAQPVMGDTDRLIQQRIQEFVDYLDNGHLQAHPYDIYHAQDCISANALLILRQRGLIPHFIRTVHHIDDFNSPYLQECQERSILEPDLCLCVSKYWQKELQTRYQIHAPQIINGVDSKRFSTLSDNSEIGLKERLGLKGSPIYLTVGGIEPRKNSIRLLQAFAQVLKSHPLAQLVIAGGATLFDYQSYRDDFFVWVKQLGVEVGRSLLLPGVIADHAMPALYRCADAFVFPSLKEGWGLVVLEAIASGLPVLTTHAPPFTEFLNPQQALLIDAENTDAIAQAMLKIIQPQIAQTLVHHSQSICQTYTWENSANLHLEQYLKF
jgi:glycosyltransferase-like protein